MELFHWSLREIDLTDIESLIPFAFYYPQWREKRAQGNGRSKQAYADEVDWL